MEASKYRNSGLTKEQVAELDDLQTRLREKLRTAGVSGPEELEFQRYLRGTIGALESKYDNPEWGRALWEIKSSIREDIFDGQKARYVTSLQRAEKINEYLEKGERPPSML